MTFKELALPKHFFKDDHGRVVLWQSPNIPLYGWLLFKAVSLVANKGQLQTGLQHLSTAFLFTWALLEITAGINYFRRFLGLVVISFIIVGFFR